MVQSNNQLVYYAPVGPGGLTDYAVHQLVALRDLGVSVVCLAPAHLMARLSNEAGIEFVALPEADRVGSSRIARAIASLRRQRRWAKLLAQTVSRRGAKSVVIAAYSEYFAPFWAGPLRRLRDSGVRIGTVVHDPVRDFVVGPRWWHERSISVAYSFVDVAFVHGPGPIDRGTPRREIKIVEIPHGLYQFPAPDPLPSQDEVRSNLGLPTDGKYLLSFGHVRDGKNLDLAIQALIEAPDWRLIVAGREQSSGQRPVSWYQDMARQLGVHQRCHWFHEFIETDGIWKFFTASDVALLLYSADFHSASGVLSANAQFGLPVIASGGEGPLCQDVNEYAIGRWLGRPSATGVADALAALPQSIDELSARWRRYCVDHTWSQNAQLVLAGLNMSSASGSRRLAERSIAASN